MWLPKVHFSKLIVTRADVLQGGRDMESSSPSKRVVAVGSDDER